MEDHIPCKELVELVTEYLEGKLPGNIHRQFELHLSGCEGCTNYLEQMRQTIRLTGKINEEKLTPQQRVQLLKMFRDWKSP